MNIEHRIPNSEHETDVAPPDNSASGPAGRDSMFDVLFAQLHWLKDLLDYLGGSRETPPPGASLAGNLWWRGLWWGFLIGAIALFCGQTSKFIYIDF